MSPESAAPGTGHALLESEPEIHGALERPGQPGTERPAEAGLLPSTRRSRALGSEAAGRRRGSRSEGQRALQRSPGILRVPAGGTRWPGARGEPVDVLRAAREPPPPPREEECTGRATAGRARHRWRCWPRCCWPHAGLLPKVSSARARVPPSVPQSWVASQRLAQPGAGHLAAASTGCRQEASKDWS